MPNFTVSADTDAFLQAANDAAARGELALTALAITAPGTGVATALGVNVGSAGAFLTFNGAGGTPSSMVGTNITGTAAGLTAGAASAIAVGGITGLGTGVATFLATPSGANLATALTTALPATKGGTGLTALGTGIATALGVNANAGGGLIVLADPGADRIPFWDDSAGAFVFLTVSTGLDITNTTLTATANANAVTLASAAAGAGLLIVSAGADRTATATDTVDTINATNANATTFVLGGVTITATGTELNFTDGVTSAIQTQLNAKANLTGGNTLSGAQLFAEGGTLQLDTALSADGAFCGITEAGTAGATLVFGDVCYLAAADSRWELTDADAAATSGPVKIGICVLAAAADGSPTMMLLFGKIRADSVFPSFTISAPVFLSGTAGDVTNTAPSATDSVTRIVGYGNTADELFFCPDPTWITHT